MPQTNSKCPHCGGVISASMAGAIMANNRDPEQAARTARENGKKGGYWKNFKTKEEIAAIEERRREFRAMIKAAKMRSQ